MQLLGAAFALAFAQAAEARADIPEFYKFASEDVAGVPGPLVGAEPVADEAADRVAYRFLYRTTGASAEPTIASAVLVAPAKRADSPAKTIVCAHDSEWVA